MICGCQPSAAEVSIVIAVNAGMVAVVRISQPEAFSLPICTLISVLEVV